METDENILSLETLQRIYHLVIENLRLAREKFHKNQQLYPTKLKTEDMVMIKTHAEGQFQPKFKGYYRIISFKGNQVQVRPVDGGKPLYVHISDVKYVMPVESLIPHLPLPNQFGGAAKYNINPNKVPNLHWTLSSELNTKPKTLQVKEEIPIKITVKLENQNQ